MEQVTIALAADGAFCRQLAVTISSISRWTAGVPHRIFVFHDGYSDDLQARVGQSASADVELRWVDARSSDLDAAILPAYLPPATLYRLRMAELLPADVDRVLFIDTDVVVRASLVELWNRDLGGAMLGAVRDAVYPWAASPQCLDWVELGVAPDQPYFNAGVMLIPLDAWREESIGEKALKLLGEHTFRYGDQCALNVTAGGDWLALEPKWNLQSGHVSVDSLAWITEPSEAMEAATQHPAVVHLTYFLGQLKPWQANSTSRYRDLWFEELDRTAWAGWRPHEVRTNPIRLVARRVKQAGRVLLSGA